METLGSLGAGLDGINTLLVTSGVDVEAGTSTSDPDSDGGAEVLAELPLRVGEVPAEEGPGENSFSTLKVVVNLRQSNMAPSPGLELPPKSSLVTRL